MALRLRSPHLSVLRRSAKVRLGCALGVAAIALVGCSSAPSSPQGSAQRDGAGAKTTTPHSTTHPDRTEVTGNKNSTTTQSPSDSVPTTAPPRGTTTTVASGRTHTVDGVTITACRPYKSYWLLDGVVENQKNSAHRFQIDVGFELPSGKVIDTRSIDTDSLAPGASTNWGASGAKDLPSVTCIVQKVHTY